MTYLLSHPLWGWLSLPDYPCAWSPDKARAHYFANHTAALMVRHHWNEAVEITIHRENRAMSKHDEDLLQTRNKQLMQQLKNATPTAYAQRWDGKYWVFLITPAGVTTRLASHYVTIEGAEQAIVRYGFVRIDPPTNMPPTTLWRGNTTPR